MRFNLQVALLCAWLLPFACGCHEGAPELSPKPQVFDQVAWKRELLALRAASDVEMKTSSTSPFAAVARYPVAAREPTFVTFDGSTVSLTNQGGPQAALALEPDGARWGFRTLLPGLTGTDREGQSALPPGLITTPVLVRLGAHDQHDGTPPRFSVLVQPVAEDLVVTLYDRQADALGRYHGLVHYAPDPRFAVFARIVRHENPETVRLQTTLGLEKTFLRYAQLGFELSGRSYVLHAFRAPGASHLLVPFQDATTGKGSYGAGRYLDLELPTQGDTVFVDFNRAYSPLCSYSPAFNCALPPVENQLAVAIQAGEMTYPH